MKPALVALALALAAGTASAQQYAAAEDYRTCPPALTSEGLSVVENQCGSIQPPSFAAASFSTLGELQAGETTRDDFNRQVAEYGRCVSRFIDSYRRPGGDASSSAPDQAACAHSWAQDQVVQVVRDYGRACIDFSNRSMMDRNLQPWSGSCYPQVNSEQG